MDYRSLKRNFDHGHMPRYPVWANFTKYLAENYSINHLIEIMEEYSKNPTKQNYEKLFKKHFKKSERQLFNEFIKK